jgi:hypothetical protein
MAVDITTHVRALNKAQIHTFQIKIYLHKYMQPILK